MNSPIKNIIRAAATAALLSLVATFSSARAAEDIAGRAMNSTGSVPVKEAGPYVEVGSYRIWVSTHLGRPGHVLSDGTWVYQGFTVEDSQVKGALLVAFRNGRVSDLRLISPQVLTALLARPSTGALIARR